jgi:hypothetical protein
MGYFKTADSSGGSCEVFPKKNSSPLRQRLSFISLFLVFSVRVIQHSQRLYVLIWIEVTGRLNLGKWNDNGSLEKLILSRPRVK